MLFWMFISTAGYSARTKIGMLFYRDICGVKNKLGTNVIAVCMCVVI